MNNLIITFLKFAIIGFGNSILDTVVWKLLTKIFVTNQKIINFLHKIRMNEYSGAQVISFLVSLTSSFFLNSYFTWKVNPLDSTNRAILYALVAITSWIVTTAFINYFTQEKYLIKFNSLTTTLKAKMEFFDYPLLIKITSILISMIINFIGYNYFVFR